MKKEKILSGLLICGLSISLLNGCSLFSKEKESNVVSGIQNTDPDGKVVENDTKYQYTKTMDEFIIFAKNTVGNIENYLDTQSVHYKEMNAGNFDFANELDLDKEQDNGKLQEFSLMVTPFYTIDMSFKYDCTDIGEIKNSHLAKLWTSITGEEYIAQLDQVIQEGLQDYTIVDNCWQVNATYENNTLTVVGSTGNLLGITKNK